MGNDYAGSNKLWFKKGTELSDASAVMVIPLTSVSGTGSLLVDVVSDKGCTVDLVRYLDEEKEVEGVPGTQGVVSDGGPSGAFIYPDLGCVKAELTITKTEAGTTSGFAVSVREEAG